MSFLLHVEEIILDSRLQFYFISMLYFEKLLNYWKINENLAEKMNEHLRLQSLKNLFLFVKNRIRDLIQEIDKLLSGYHKEEKKYHTNLL